MNIITTVLIAFGLAADAFAASITSGIKIKRLSIKNALMIATFFGFFQAIMPLVGWLVGRSLNVFSYLRVHSFTCIFDWCEWSYSVQCGQFISESE